MNALDKLAAMDRAIVEAWFQPIQDLVSQWRQRSDHVLAIVMLTASLGVYAMRALFFDIDSSIWTRVGWVGLTAAVCAMLSAALFLHGAHSSNIARPGCLEPQWAVRVILIVLFALGFLISLMLRDGVAALLRTISDMLFLSGHFFGACALRRPPPIERRAPAFAHAIRI